MAAPAQKGRGQSWFGGPDGVGWIRGVFARGDESGGLAPLPVISPNLARTASSGAIGSGSLALGLAATTAPFGTQLAGPPLPGAKLTLQEGRDVEVSIELGPMKAKPGGGNLDVGQGFWRGVAETFHEVRRDGELKP